MRWRMKSAGIAGGAGEEFSDTIRTAQAGEAAILGESGKVPVPRVR